MEQEKMVFQTKMKKNNRTILTVLFVFCFFTLLAAINGCQSNGNNTTNSSFENSNKKPAEVTNKPNALPEDNLTSDTVTVPEQVLFEQSGVKLTLKSLEDGMLGSELKVLVESSNDAPVTVQVRDCSVNNHMFNSVIFSSNVASGKKNNDAIKFMSSQLTENGIKTLGTIELSFHVFNSDTWDTIFDTETITIKTSVADRVSQPPLEEKTIVFEQDGIEISFVDFDTDSFWGQDIKIYIENNSNTAITVQARDTSINGFMIDGTMSCDVMPEKMANTTLSFFKSSLEDNGIESIESVELKFHIFEKDSWDTIVDTDIIKIEK